MTNASTTTVVERPQPSRRCGTRACMGPYWDAVAVQSNELGLALVELGRVALQGNKRVGLAIVVVVVVRGGGGEEEDTERQLGVAHRLQRGRKATGEKESR